MLIVVNEACDHHTEHVVPFDVLVNVSIAHDEVHTLQAVQDVRDTVIRVVLKVAHLQLTCKVDEVVLWDVIEVEEVVVLEDLERQELKRVLIQDLLEVECIELYRMECCDSLLVRLTNKFTKVELV